MNANQKRKLLWLTIIGFLATGLIVSFWPRAVLVDLQPAEVGPMMLTVGDEGETRVVDVYVVSAPVTGRLRRIETEPGDAVVAGQTIIAEVEPQESQLLDPRTEAEAEAQLSAAKSAASLAQAELEKAAAELRFAESGLRRAGELAAKGTISERDFEVAERAFNTNRAAMRVAQANMQVRQFELERARAQVMSPEEIATLREACKCIDIKSPVDGQVLRVLRESEGFVQAGEGLVEVGNPERLEIVVDLLSSDAVKIQPGNLAVIENWGGATPLQARVRRVEPFGFTKISALGIEEQRVNVLLDIISPHTDWQALGHGYQVDVRVVLWQQDKALRAPLTALFRVDEKWALFVEEDGRAVQRMVEVGHTSAKHAEVVSGLSEGEKIVVYPGRDVEEGTRIAGR